MPWEALPPAEMVQPTRRGKFIDIEIFGGLSLGGDIISANWDGATPLSLASADSTATSGFALDSSEGAIQVQKIFAEGGEIGNLDIVSNLTLATGGAIRTATSGQRIELTEAEEDRIRLFTGDSFEAASSTIRAGVSGSGDSRTLQLAIFSPPTTGDAGASNIVIRSESFDDSSSPPGVVFAYSGGSTQEPRFQLQNGFYTRYSGSSGSGRIEFDDLGATDKLVIGIGTNFDDGIYSPGDSELGFVVAGNEIFKIDSAGIKGLAWKTWSPTLVNLTKGNGTEVARYVQIGDTVIAQYSLTLGSTSAMGSIPTITSPVTMAASNANMPIGVARMLDSGTAFYMGEVDYNSSTTFGPKLLDASSTYLVIANPSSITPFTWTTNDVLALQVIFEAA